MLYTTHGASTIEGIFRAQRDLLAGFTTIRDCGGCRTGDALAIRDAINAGKIDGPRMVASGPFLVTSASQNLYQDGGYTFDSPDEARHVARLAVASGVDQLKHLAIGHVTLAEMQAITGVAHDTGKLCAIHATDRLAIYNAAQAAPTTIEHGIEIDEECLEIMLRNNVALIPTFCPYYFTAEHADDVMHFTPERAALTKARYERHASHLPWLIKSGLTIGFGADTGATLTKHGKQAFEMELMHRNGMETVDVLLAATAVNSRLLRLDDQIGTLEAGKQADIVAFDGDPLTDIRVMQSCAFVMRSGVVYKGAEASKLKPAL
jgi:imidazolonepropionase-like amidohydrolase